MLALGGGTALAAPALMGNVSHRDSGSMGVCSQAGGTARGVCASDPVEKGTSHSSNAGAGTSQRGSEAGTSSSDAHGMAVSAAAKSCAHGTTSDRDAHGDCVSAVARKTR